MTETLALFTPPATAAPAPKLPADWLAAIGDEFAKPYMLKLKEFLQQQKEQGKVVYPKGGEIFNALNETPLRDVKVVILGQDPYHGPNQAHGLAFSVRKGVRLPPSLVNIYKEIEDDCAVKMPRDGDLTGWARQGVLLLNATLTVEQANAGSHQRKGWEELTDAIIHKVAEENENVVFILWGSYAQKKGAFIDRQKHLVLESVHPSPLSAHRGFLGSKPFSAANAYLKEHGRTSIEWNKLDV